MGQAQNKEAVNMLMKRVGQFSVPTELMQAKPELVMVMFRDVIVLKAGPINNGASVHYTAVSINFRELNANDTIPEYECQLVQGKDSASLQWTEMPTKLIERVRSVN